MANLACFANPDNIKYSWLQSSKILLQRMGFSVEAKDTEVDEKGTMTRTEKELFDRAVHQYGSIEPCAGKTFTECFSSRDGSIQFWFNDRRGNTHLIIKKNEGFFRSSRKTSNLAAAGETS